MRWLGWLTKRLGGYGKAEGELPTNMNDLRGGDPCWCGSGKSYRRCHRGWDRRKLKEACQGGAPPARNPFL